MYMYMQHVNVYVCVYITAYVYNFVFHHLKGLPWLPLLQTFIGLVLEKHCRPTHDLHHRQARERVVDLAELSMHISEIAQDQYGSRPGRILGVSRC